MQLRLSILVFIFAVTSCQARQDSALKDGVAVGPGGRTILFKKAESGVLIKECVDYPQDLLTRKDCEKKSGTTEARPTAQEFRNHLKAVLKVSSGSFSEEMQRKVDLYNKGKLDNIADLETQRNKIHKQLEIIRNFIQSVKDDDPKNPQDPADRQEIAKLEDNLARVEGRLQDNSDLVSAVREINGLISKLVDDIILDSSKFEVFLYNNKDKEKRFFFNILSSYVKKIHTLRWGFVELSQESGSGFPAEFRMGSNEFPEERPIRSVRLTRPFAVQKTEVTQEQWFEIMGTNPSRFASKRICGDDYDTSRFICPEHPVESVSWPSVQEFIKKLNAKTDLDCGDTATKEGFLKASNTPGCFRLPTEAEWEYFTRAGTSTAFNLGENISARDVNYDGKYPYINTELGVYGEKGPSRKRTVAVGSLNNANNWGLSDTHGNVWEWVQDWYNKDYYANSPEENPLNSEGAEARVVRGGSWYNNGWHSRSANRNVGGTYDSVGFRLVRTSSP